MFAYEDGGRQYLPRPRTRRPRPHAPARRLWREKYRLITEIYGFAPDSWEARTTPREEAFWCFDSSAGRQPAHQQSESQTMKILVLYEYPPSPGGLATQGDLLYRGLQELGVDVHPVHLESGQEKEWYYRWFKPDVVVGVGYWGHTPHLVLHPQRYGVQPVPWLVADGYVANYREVLNALPLILVTSNWVKEVYIRDGIDGDNIEVLPVGCDTDPFVPRDRRRPARCQPCARRWASRRTQIMILTVGGDAASRARRRSCRPWRSTTEGPRLEVRLQGLAAAAHRQQNLEDLQLATHLGIDKKRHLHHQRRLAELHAVPDGGLRHLRRALAAWRASACPRWRPAPAASR